MHNPIAASVPQTFRISGSSPAGSAAGAGEAAPPHSSVQEGWDFTNDQHMVDASLIASVEFAASANHAMHIASDAAHIISEQYRFHRSAPANCKKGKFERQARSQYPALSAHSARSRSEHGEALQEVCNQHANGNSFDDANGSPFEEESYDAEQMLSASANSKTNKQSADAQDTAPPLATGDDAKTKVAETDCSDEPAGKAAIPSEPHCG